MSIAASLAAGVSARAASAARRYTGNPTGFLRQMAPMYAAIGGERARVARQAALAFVLESMTNYAKTNAPFTDRTGNLRRSNANEVFEDGRETIGVLANTANYAIDVERRPAYWVLSGAVRVHGPMIEAMLGVKLNPNAFMGPSESAGVLAQ